MKVDEKGHTIVIKSTEENSLVFFEKLTQQHEKFKNHNLILDLTHDKSVTIATIKIFKDISKVHKKGKKSVIIVAENIDFNAVPNSIVVVPSLLEAHDCIELDEIERELGF